MSSTDLNRRNFLAGIATSALLIFPSLLPFRTADAMAPIAIRLLITSVRKQLIKGARQARGFASGVTIEQAGAYLISQHGWKPAAHGLAGISAYAVSGEVAAAIEQYHARALLIQRNVENHLTILIHNPSSFRVKDFIIVSLEDVQTGETHWYCEDELLVDLEPQGFKLQELTITDVLSPGIKRIHAESVDGTLVSPDSDNIVVATENQLLIGE